MNDFYDPDFYTNKIGIGSRVNSLYLKTACEVGGPVLELGCGVGDVLLPIARKGITVYGLDRSQRMLDAFRRRLLHEDSCLQSRVHLIEARMEALSMLNLPPDIRLIIIPNDGIANVLDLSSLRSIFSACIQTIAPGGYIVFDVSFFDVAYLGRFCGASNETARFRSRHALSDGNEVLVWERTSYDSCSGILTADFRYEYINADGELFRTLCRRLLLCPRRVEELVLALIAARFEEPKVEALSADDTGVSESNGFIVRARCPLRLEQNRAVR